MFRSIMLRKILSTLAAKLPFRAMLSGPVSTMIFVIIVAVASIAFLPQEEMDTLFPTLESMWNNIP